MKDFLLKKDKVKALCAEASEEWEVYIPLEDSAKEVHFARLSPQDKEASLDRLNLDYQSLVIPPKTIVFPQLESMFEFNRQKIIETTKVSQKKMLFGLRACDTKAILFLDDFFKRQFPDIYYLNRSADKLLVIVCCRQPLESCFCTSAESGPFFPLPDETEKGNYANFDTFDGALLRQAQDTSPKDTEQRRSETPPFKAGKQAPLGINPERSDRHPEQAPAFRPESRRIDLQLVDLDDEYAVEIGSDKGAEFVDRYQNFFTKAKDEDLKRKDKAKQEARESVILKVDFAGAIKKFCADDVPKELYERIAQRCIYCGGCLYICPTCSCFNVFDEQAGSCGVRFRNWDACVFSGYTREASGHNPRNEKWIRAARRYEHKLKYDYLATGSSGCVGCGRCLAVCPVNIGISQIIQEVSKE